MKKVLIIEDDLVLSEMYALKLKKEGYDVMETVNGLDALTVIPDFEPDIILLDIMMPTMNGFETLRAIKNQTSSNSKIIMFTNIVDQDKIDESIEYGADDYLIKANTNPSDICIKIEELLKKETEITNQPIRINPGLNIFKMKNPINNEDIEISINIKI